MPFRHRRATATGYVYLGIIGMERFGNFLIGALMERECWSVHSVSANVELCSTNYLKINVGCCINAFFCITVGYCCLFYCYCQELRMKKHCISAKTGTFSLHHVCIAVSPK